MKNANKTLVHKALSVLLFSSAVLLTPFAIAAGGEEAVDPHAVEQLVTESVQPAGSALSAEYQQKVNINLASYEQLIALPGIGRVKAAAIINYRKEVGMFKALEDIQNIKGIGQKLYTRLADKINI
jgi:competence protein ComEA